MKTLYKQCNLTSGNSHMSAWLEADKIKVGYKVTLKDSDNPEEWWTIDSIGSTALPKDDIKGSHAPENWYKNDYRQKLKGLTIQK